jgi:heme/copper-type cytochrome/quinol oxidase subunit 4
MSIFRKYIKSGVSNSILALLVILVLLAESLWWLHAELLTEFVIKSLLCTSHDANVGSNFFHPLKKSSCEYWKAFSYIFSFIIVLN